MGKRHGRSATSWALRLLPLLLLLVAAAGDAVVSITNRCSYTVWPGYMPGCGVRLDPGKSGTLNVSGGGWVKETGCESSSPTPTPPNDAAEYSIGQSLKDSIEISFIVPIDSLPAPAKGGTSACTAGRPRSAANITTQCTVLKQSTQCRTDGCEYYSLLRVQTCPDAYSNSSTMFDCPAGTNYQAVFCPPIDLTSSPPNPPTAAPSATAPPNPPAPTATSMRHSASMNGLLGGIVGSIVAFILILAFIFFITNRRGTLRRQEMAEEEEEFGSLQGTPIRFTFQQLEVATEQFRNKLGEGGFGSVFEGWFGEERIAVKRLDRAGQGKREFLAEVQTIGSIHHINLLRLISFCAEKSHTLLVYEYMPRGSLDRWIYGRHSDSVSSLEWRTRPKIITDIAKGLSYLHEECMKKIAHLDVKPQNILLDDNFNVKLSHFGLCKLIDRDVNQVVTKMRGTPGYLAPEWLTSQITEKTDIYSFGVVVMEIIDGRKNLDTSRSEESIHPITLLEEKVDCKRRPKMLEVDKVLEDTINKKTSIDHIFVPTSPATFGISKNVCSSADPVASNVLGPR